jgi:hypothetical protein
MNRLENTAEDINKYFWKHWEEVEVDIESMNKIEDSTEATIHIKHNIQTLTNNEQN